MRFYEFIDKIVYINLDSRPDRDSQITSEFKRLKIPENKILRFSGIQNKIGHIGCYSSHINVMQLAIKNNWKNCLVLEDDFKFIDDIELIDQIFTYFFNNFDNNYWDILNLARGYYQNIKDIGIPYIQKVCDVSTTSGFLANNKIYKELLSNLIEGLSIYKQDPTKEYYSAIDRNWTRLLYYKNWFITYPSLGYQRESFSDISNCNVSYLQYDNTISVIDCLKSQKIKSQNSITIVSAYYNLLLLSKYSNDIYLKWLDNFLQMPFYLVFFLDIKKDKDIYEFIKIKRKHFGFKTYIYNLSMEEFITYKYLDYWKFCKNIDIEKYHSEELYIIWNEKIFLVEKATKINPFKSEWFFWVDSGSIRDYSMIEKIIEFPNIKIIEKYLKKNKILFSLINDFEKEDLMLNNNNIPIIFQNKDETACCSIKNRIQGGFFGCHLNMIPKFVNIFTNELELFMNTNTFGGKDQYIFSSMYVKYTDDFILFLPNKNNVSDDIWFEFYYKFSTDYLNEMIIIEIYDLFKKLEKSETIDINNSIICQTPNLETSKLINYNNKVITQSNRKMSAKFKR
jgi:glycosyl transferase family 25